METGRSGSSRQGNQRGQGWRAGVQCGVQHTHILIGGYLDRSVEGMHERVTVQQSM